MPTFTTELSSTSVPSTTKYVPLVVFSSRIYDVTNFPYLVMLYIYVDIIIERKYIIYLHFLSFFLLCNTYIKTCYTLNHIISSSLPLHYPINRPLVVIVVSLYPTQLCVVCVYQWKKFLARLGRFNPKIPCSTNTWNNCFSTGIYM